MNDVTSLPIWRTDLSLPAKLIWSAWHIGLSISDDAWDDFLVKTRREYVSKDQCLSELRTAGWLAQGVRP